MNRQFFENYVANSGRVANTETPILEVEKDPLLNRFYFNETTLFTKRCQLHITHLAKIEKWRGGGVDRGSGDT